ncbi:hypothetical protein DRW03_21165 [Corallococcus sp. H22C18031201]|nr:hypothetical protein DRW03_21165 [Corallococcus sp. H22C18031201]
MARKAATTAAPAPADVKSKLVTFRAPPDIQEHLKRVQESGGEASAAIFRALRHMRDLEELLGIEDWAELEKRAKIRKVTEAVIVAELVQPSLASARSEHGRPFSGRGEKK